MPLDPASRKLYRRIAASIADSIEAGRYLPGHRLPGERELAEAYNVSRPTIREAMIALEMLGWIEARHGSGLYVTRGQHGSPREEALELDVGPFDLTEARTLFEGEAAALAARAITADQLAELDGLLREMDEAAGRGDRAAAVDADRRFHAGIATATGNAAIRSVVEYLWEMRNRSPLCVNIFQRAERGGVDPRVDEHRAILDALARGDDAGARAAMRAHLRRVVDDLLEVTELEVLERARSEIEARRSKVASRLAL